MTPPPKSADLELRAGDWVEVRSREEILQTLNRKGALEGMPFMPEMLDYCGRTLRVVKSAHKTCDTITGDCDSRRVAGAFHLEDIRCNGRSHGECDAACLIFWKEAWLKRPGAPAAPVPTPGRGCTVEDLLAAARVSESGDRQSPSYLCQATELLRASRRLHWWDIRQYIQDYRSRNVRLGEVVDRLAYAVASNLIRAAQQTRTGADRLLIRVYDRVQAVRGGLPYPRKRGTIPLGDKTPSNAPLNLQPGELVRVKSYEKILATLNVKNRNRGLFFDAEHVPYCGAVYRVRSRVNKIIDEKNGKLIEFKTDLVTLEGATCQAHYSEKRMFCPRAIYPYWREIWLERVNSETGVDSAAHVGPSERGN